MVNPYAEAFELSKKWGDDEFQLSLIRAMIENEFKIDFDAVKAGSRIARKIGDTNLKRALMKRARADLVCS